MKFLFLLNPLKSRSRALRNGSLLKTMRESGEVRDAGAVDGVRVCAPGPDTRAQAKRMLEGSGEAILPQMEEENAYLEAAEKLRGASPEAVSRRTAYYQGEGPAAEALFSLLRRIRSEVFDFDVLVSTLPAPLLRRAASISGSLSIRTDLWPGIWGRWLYFSILRCRTAEGIDPLEQLCLSDLRGLGLHEVPASVDQRLHGTQPVVNPYECGFAPLDEHLARAFHSTRKTALVVPQTGPDAVSTGGYAFSDPQEFLEAALPPLLKAGWQCLIIGETASGRHLAGPWADRDRVFLIEEGNESELKEERRKILALLAQSDLLVTDNSPTAMEAMMYERPVCVLGRPFFALGDAFPRLEDVLSGEFDAQAYREAGSLIRAFFLRAYGSPFFGPGSARRLMHRIGFLADLTLNFDGHAPSWAQAVYDRFGKPNRGRWLQRMREEHARLEQFPRD